MFDDVIINLAYAIVFLSLAVRDVLLLRLIMTLGSVCFIVYGLDSANDYMVFWHVIFISINIYQAVRLVIERRPVRLSPEMERVYRHCFSNMKRRDFLNFWHFGNEVCYVDCEVCHQGKTPEALLYLVNGHAEVEQQGETVARLGDNNFIAEMSFMTEHPASADVRVTGKTLVWTREKLQALEKLNPDLLDQLRTSIGKDLSLKLKQAPKLSDTWEGGNTAA